MKKLLFIIGIPVLAAIVAITALLLFVDPNQFKPLIAEQTKKQTGLDLVIDGDISWRIFPTLGLSLGKTEVKNPHGFQSENLLKINAIGVDVAVVPLFSRELMVGNVLLDGAEIYLETLKDGRSNLDRLTKKSEPVATVEKQPSTEKGQKVPEAVASASAAQEWKINLAGVSVTNASLEIRDAAKGSYTKLYDVGLAVSEFSFDRWTEVTFEAKGRNNLQAFTAKGHAELILSQGYASYKLRNIVFDSTFDDPTTSISLAKVELNTFEFNSANKLIVTVKGKASDLDLDLTLHSDLIVDKAISQIQLKSMDLKTKLVGSALPQSPMLISAHSDFEFDLNSQLISLALKKLALNAIELDGNATVQLTTLPKIRFALHSKNIDVDAFLAGKETTASAKSEPEEKSTSGNSVPSGTNEVASAQTDVEPDLTALNTLDVQGKVSIDKFKANNTHMQNVTSEFSVNRGVVELKSFTSNLYQGSINATAYLDGRNVPATYWAKKQIKNVQVQPLLKDAVNNDMLEGTGNIDVNVKGKSLIPENIKQNLAGSVKITFADGAVNGINVAQIIRTNYAKIKGQKIEESAKESKKTDFSAMGATLILSQGVMTTNDLSMQSPLLRLRGEGYANYLKQTMDMELNTSIVGTLEGQGGKDINELKDVTIPVRLFGQWTKPEYEIEFDKLWKKLEKEKKKQLEKKAEKEVNKFLDKSIKDEKTKALADQLLKSLFN